MFLNQLPLRWLVMVILMVRNRMKEMVNQLIVPLWGLINLLLVRPAHLTMETAEVVVVTQADPLEVDPMVEDHQVAVPPWRTSWQWTPWWSPQEVPEFSQ
jgi:hypothetical protein